jgi:hypothetical protein
METTTPEKVYVQGISDIDEILKDVQSEGMDSLKGIITDIETLMEQRQSLSKEISNDLEKVKMDLSNFLSVKWKEMTVKELMELKKKEIEIEEGKINEKLNFWKDVANLKRELRIHIAEFQNKQNQQNMLTNLMDF